VAEEPEQSNSARLIVAIVLGVGLAAAVLVVVLGGSGGGDDSKAGADEACIDDWNSDEEQVAFGLHQFQGHGYSAVQVTRVAEDGELTDDEDETCAVIFAKDPLQPEQEPGAGARVQLEEGWSGFESLGPVTSEEITQLQGEAVTNENATLTTEGRLVAD